MGDNTISDIILDRLSASRLDALSSVTDTPEECIRSNPEPYDAGDSGIAGSIGWAVGFSFILFFGTFLIALLIRKFCCKERCNESTDDKPSCARRTCSLFTLMFLPMVFGVVTGVLVYYWPQDPIVNDCTQNFDLEKLVTNFVTGDAALPMSILISIYNPNPVDITIKASSGTIDYENTQIGDFSFSEFTAKRRSITDTTVNVAVVPPDTETILQMSEDYFNNDDLVLIVRLDVDFKVAGFSGSETNYVETISSGYRSDNNPNEYGLCKCPP